MSKILNMTKFWIWQGSQNGRVTQFSEYPKICLDSVLDISQVLKMPGFYDYGRVLNKHTIQNIPQYGWICLNRMWICLSMSEFTIIDTVLNISHIIHSVRLLYKFMSLFWEMAVFRTLLKLTSHSILHYL